jgi:hypothetical protein
MAVQSPLDIHCMFLPKDIRTKQEQCQEQMGLAVISLRHQDLAHEARNLAAVITAPHRGKLGMCGKNARPPVFVV